MIKMGLRLKKERLRLKLSQSALGAIGGVEINTQSNYENGTRSPKADYLSLIARAGVDITYVITGFSMDRARPVVSAPYPAVHEHLNHVITRLHESLHDVTQNLYHVTRVVEELSNDQLDKSQLETIKADAEAITVATVRLIYMTSGVR